ncbi:MAG: uncharacterized protein PWQ37_1482 [Candidatus Petromonas sp.]|nr:uncharacterized protein [Candidatus Petromonas sp.]
MNVIEIKRYLKKLPKLFFGFSLCSLGILLMLYSDLGMNPWGIFHQGLSLQTGLTFGRISQLTGLVVILISIPLGIIPGFATILNMYFIGYFIDLIDSTNLLFTPSSLWGRLLLLGLGICVFSGGIYFYLSCGLGAGPRDGLMLGLMQKLNRPVSQIKTAIEVSVLIIGFLLGGSSGIGTLIIAMTIGFTVETAFKIGNFDPKQSLQRSLKDDYYLLFKYQDKTTKINEQ